MARLQVVEQFLRNLDMDLQGLVIGDHRHLTTGGDPFPLLGQLALHQSAEGGQDRAFLQFQLLAVDCGLERRSAFFQPEHGVMVVIVKRFRDRFFGVEGLDALQILARPFQFNQRLFVTGTRAIQAGSEQIAA